MASHIVARIKRKQFDRDEWICGPPVGVTENLVKLSVKTNLTLDYKLFVRRGKYRRSGKLGEYVVKVEFLKVTDAQLKKMTGR